MYGTMRCDCLSKIKKTICYVPSIFYVDLTRRAIAFHPVWLHLGPSYTFLRTSLIEYAYRIFLEKEKNVG